VCSSDLKVALDSSGGQSSFAGAGASALRAAAGASEDVTSAVAARARQLQAALPTGSQGRVTMGVGVGRDSAGAVRTVVGTSEANGYLRRGVNLNAGEELATGTGHAEENILGYMAANGIEASSVGAGRPICPNCAGLLQQRGVAPATPLKRPR